MAAVDAMAPLTLPPLYLHEAPLALIPHGCSGACDVKLQWDAIAAVHAAVPLYCVQTWPVQPYTFSKCTMDLY